MNIQRGIHGTMNGSFKFNKRSIFFASSPYRMLNRLTIIRTVVMWVFVVILTVLNGRWIYKVKLLINEFHCIKKYSPFVECLFWDCQVTAKQDFKLSPEEFDLNIIWILGLQIFVPYSIVPKGLGLFSIDIMIEKWG